MATNKSSFVYQLDVLDIFYTPGSDKPSQKWRKAKVLQSSGRKIRINYIGWDSKFDETLDILTDSNRISELGTKTTDQTSRSVSAMKTSKSPKKESQNADGSSRNKEKSFIHKVTNIFKIGDNNQIDDDESHIAVASVAISQKKSSSSFSNKFWKIGDLVSSLGRSTIKEESVGNDTDEDGDQDSAVYMSNHTINKVKDPSEAMKDQPENRVNEKFEEQTEDVMHRTAEEMAAEIEKEKRFIESLAKKGLHVIEIEGDGNCLFRAISHQIYLNEEHHEELRFQCVQHLMYHRKRFELFCPENFEAHVREMSRVGTWGDDLEIRAMEEIIDRNIRIYSSDSPNPDVPINNNFEEDELLSGLPPLNLSYHGCSHYNSIYSEEFPLPLHSRDSSILLQARIALFEGRPVKLIKNKQNLQVPPSPVVVQGISPGSNYVVAPVVPPSPGISRNPPPSSFSTPKTISALNPANGTNDSTPNKVKSHIRRNPLPSGNSGTPE